MKKYTKYLVLSLLVLSAFVLGGWITYKSLVAPKMSIEEQSTILLEKVKTVAKLVSVEGYFSEIYTHGKKVDPFPYLPFPSFGKKAIIIVRAKVSVGYDLEKMTIETDHTNKVLRISNIPKPEIIALDHDLEYYDIQESTFNSFTHKELTSLNANAKAFIQEKALKSELINQAKQQGNQMLDVIRFMAENAGWTVEFEHEKMLD